MAILAMRRGISSCYVFCQLTPLLAALRKVVTKFTYSRPPTLILSSPGDSWPVGILVSSSSTLIRKHLADANSAGRFDRCTDQRGVPASLICSRKTTASRYLLLLDPWPSPDQHVRLDHNGVRSHIHIVERIHQGKVISAQELCSLSASMFILGNSDSPQRLPCSTPSLRWVYRGSYSVQNRTRAR